MSAWLPRSVPRRAWDRVAARVIAGKQACEAPGCQFPLVPLDHDDRGSRFGAVADHIVPVPQLRRMYGEGPALAAAFVDPDNLRPVHRLCNSRLHSERHPDHGATALPLATGHGWTSAAHGVGGPFSRRWYEPHLSPAV